VLSNPSASKRVWVCAAAGVFDLHIRARGPFTSEGYGLMSFCPPHFIAGDMYYIDKSLDKR